MLIVHILVLIVGAALILAGANFMTAGATALARRLGVSDFVIGMTLVAFGSSAPDLAVGVLSALKGHTQFALGNVVGSCLFDGLLVVGIVALMKPIEISRRLLTSQLPFLVLAYVVMFICANSHALDGQPINIITRGDGLLMLLFFGLTTWQGLKSQPVAPQPAAIQPAKTPPKPTDASCGVKAKKFSWWIVGAEVLGGLGALVWGGNLFVDGASGIAHEAHLSPTLIGLTVVALGTSLPDLATSVVAAYRGRTGIAVGNVVGSCLLDSLLVLGCSAVTAPLPMGGVSNVSMLTLLGSGILLLCFAAFSRRHTVKRWQGALFVALYAAYIVRLLLVRHALP